MEIPQKLKIELLYEPEIPLSISVQMSCYSSAAAAVVVQSLSHVQLSVTPWTAARQASLSFTISQSLLKFMSIE